MGPKTLPTIWYTYMKLVTKYQIPVINSCLEKWKKNVHIQMYVKCVATIDSRDLIFGHKLHIGTPYRGKRFGPIRFLLPVCRFC
jgi:hypothetical protein